MEKADRRATDPLGASLPADIGRLVDVFSRFEECAMTSCGAQRVGRIHPVDEEEGSRGKRGHVPCTVYQTARPLIISKHWPNFSDIPPHLPTTSADSLVPIRQLENIQVVSRVRCIRALRTASIHRLGLELQHEPKIAWTEANLFINAAGTRIIRESGFSLGWVGPMGTTLSSLQPPPSERSSSSSDTTTCKWQLIRQCHDVQ